MAITDPIQNEVADKPNSNPQPESRISPFRWFRFCLTGLVFAVSLLMPALDQIAGFSSSFKSTEKHILAPFPTLHFPHVRTYIHGFNQYYKENFGWRNALFYQYSQLKYHLLGVSPLPQKVVLGKKGWFYPGNDLNNVADQHSGLQVLEPETLRLIVRKLTDKRRQLAAQGITLYVVIAPDSYSIYSENMPDYMQRVPVASNFDRLKRYIAAHSTLSLIDVRAALREAKSTHVTYMQTDTHWNSYGALIASMAIAKRIRQNFPAIHTPSESDYAIRVKKGYSGDLITMLALNHEIADKIDYQTTPLTIVSSREVERVNNNEMGGLPSQRFVGTNLTAPRLLFVGDSYTISLATTLPGYFSTAYLTRSGSLRMDLVKAEKPSVVVVEIAERNLANLANL